MPIVKVIPCLDTNAGRVVKGVKFENLRDAGDPTELAARYNAAGADEIALLDVTASKQGRETFLDVVRRTAPEVSVPFTVGGGVRSLADVERLLAAGADRVGVNTAAIERPDLITEIAQEFGSDAVMISVDARKSATGYEVTTHGGERGRDLDAVQWARQAEDRGAGVVLVNSMDADGTEVGFDLDLLRTMRAAVSAPLIASGGAGKVEHFVAAAQTGADAVLGASVFHFGVVTVPEVKAALAAAGFEVSA